MKVAERYIARRTIAIFLVTLLWVMLIVWTTQVLVRINLVTSDGQSAGTFFQVAMLVLPAVIPTVIPFAVAIAVAQTLSTMNQDSELIVITAAGSPRSVIIRPVLILAVAASVTAFAVENFVEPHARERMRTLVAEARTELVTSIIQEGAFHEVDNGLVLQIGERLPDGNLGGVFVSDNRNEGVELIYYARRGATASFNNQQLLLLEDGIIQRRDSQGDISSVRYLTYAFDLSEFTPATGGPRLLAKDRTIGYLMNPDPDDPYFKRSPQTFVGELHRRFTDWTYALVFALVGLAVAGDARSFREARIHPLLTTMAVALVVRWAGFVATNEAMSKPAFVPVMYAIPILSIVGLTYMLATNRSLEIPTAASERMQEVAGRLHDRLTGMRFRLTRNGAGMRREPT